MAFRSHVHLFQKMHFASRAGLPYLQSTRAPNSVDAFLEWCTDSLIYNPHLVVSFDKTV